jgi:hypothetical protein
MISKGSLVRFLPGRRYGYRGRDTLYVVLSDPYPSPLRGAEGTQVVDIIDEVLGPHFIGVSALEVISQ